MSRNRIFAIVIAGVILPLAVQGAIRFPFNGKVTGSTVNVRSGPDINYYPTVRLMKGNSVRVVDEEYGWFKIVPPAGSFSLVAKQYVDASGNKTGKVNSERVAIRAGSKFTDKKSSLQLLAHKGLQVTILGSKGEYYKIVPPEGAYLWISADYVKPAVKEAAPKIIKQIKELKTIAKTPAPASSSSQPTTRPAVKKQKQDKGGAFGKYTRQMKKLNKLYAKEMKKPLMERNFGRIIEGYKSIARQKDSKLASLYAGRQLEIIDYQLRAQKGYDQLREIQKKFTQESRTIREKSAESALKEMKAPKLYQAAGILRVSNIFTGPLMPKRYRLIDPKRNKTIDYVELGGGGRINIAKYLGKYVGVYGKVRFDAKLRIDIITASSFRILSAQHAATQPVKN